MTPLSHKRDGSLTAAPKRLIQLALAAGENRVELLLVELEEERDKLITAVLLVLASAAFGVLAGITLTLTVAVVLWNRSPVLAVLALFALYGFLSVFLFLRFLKMRKEWKILATTREQLKKDSECLAELLR